MIEEAEVVLHKGIEPDLIADFRAADVLAGEHFIPIDFSASEEGAAATGHGDDAVVEWVLMCVELAVAARRGK